MKKSIFANPVGEEGGQVGKFGGKQEDVVTVISYKIVKYIEG